VPIFVKAKVNAKEKRHSTFIDNGSNQLLLSKFCREVIFHLVSALSAWLGRNMTLFCALRALLLESYIASKCSQPEIKNE
jgi:hypothetical protein